MSDAQLCETVTGRSMSELLAARDAAIAADLVELRLDGVEDADVDGALRGRRLPAVVTCRPAWEGGRFDGGEDVRLRLLTRALEGGAEFVDIEARALRESQGPAFGELVRRFAPRVVLSMHDFAAVPADLGDRVRAMRAAGAGTVKVAVAAARLIDTLPLRDIGRDGGAVVVGMGDAGLPSRLLAGRFGSRWTYAGAGVAPGQIPADRMLGEFRFRRIGPATRLFGVVSTNALHSLSPALHNAAFRDLELDAVYVPLRAADFADFLAFADALGIEGVSVTIPYKLQALEAAATSDALTRVVGAANTLRRRRVDRAGEPPATSAGWEATNTDLEGFLAPLGVAFPRPLEGVHAAILGAGGSARAVAVALTAQKALVTIHSRRSDQARGVAADLGVQPGGWPPPPGSWDLLVNCTPLGGANRRDESPLPDGPFTGPVVYDLTYGPGKSRLLRDAGAAGCITLDGLPMLVAQAERQFEWWMGRRPRTGVMAGAARARLAAETAAAAERHGVH